MSTTITGEQVRTAYAAAPQAIRTAFSSEETTAVIVALTQTYQLHVDTAGLLGKQVGWLLLGLMSPMEFLGGLVDAGVDGDTAKKIITEVNEKIFVPLRARMETAEGKERLPQPEPTVSDPAPATVAMPPAPTTPQAPLVPPPSLVPPPPQTPEPAPIQPYYAPQPAAHHPGPGWQPAAAVHVYVPTTSGIPHQPLPVHIPVDAAIPVSEPLVREAPPQPPAPQVPVSTQPEPSTVRPVPPPPVNLPGIPSPTPLEKNYGNDPYREPI